MLNNLLNTSILHFLILDRIIVKIVLIIVVVELTMQAIINDHILKLFSLRKKHLLLKKINQRIFLTAHSKNQILTLSSHNVQVIE